MNRTAPLISVIIPVFNEEKYVVRCLESIVTQGLQDSLFEIIVVDDGSTDASLEICLRYSENHGNVRVVSHVNHGPAFTRNRGVSLARGEYICFVDSDDTLASGGLAFASKYCDGENDIVRSWLVIAGEETERMDANYGKVLFRGDGREYIKRFGLETFAVNCLFRREFIANNSLCFKTGTFGEDFMFMFDCLTVARKVISIGNRFYIYHRREGSVSTNHSSDHSRCVVRDFLAFLTEVSGRTSRLFPEGSDFLSSCHLTLGHKTLSLFSRALATDFSVSEYKDFVLSCEKAGLLPLPEFKGLSHRTRFAALALKLTARFPSLFIPVRMAWNRFQKWT